MKRKLYLSLLLLVVILSSIQVASAEPKYNRENSERLFPLIEWQDYEPQTFQKALDEKKPIFLMISAPAWCYWCHVYESEDYLYHPNLYPYINENFIPVFVDSDKRPDLTRKYLEGGWPSTTIFAPDMRRINGFVGPREPLGLRSYFEQVVTYVQEREFESPTLDLRYEELSARIPTKAELSSREVIFLKNLRFLFDDEYGGFVNKNAPDWRSGQKFPAGLAHKYLLEQYEKTGDEQLLNIVQTTFNSQYTKIDELEERYRLFDPVEGGFHRYSTNQDWSIPHYEKMLYDQAKLLRSYWQLLQITDDENVRVAVEKTVDFLLTKFLNSQGGFYSSQDAYLEEEYYGLPQEERDKIGPAFIDKTRNMDSNSMMVSTFLFMYENTKNEEYKEAATRTLDFLKTNMISEDGALYYYDYDKQEAFLSGQSIANSWALLAFADAYETLDDESYLETAQELADYSLDNLYDWNSGGFFERHSQDTEFYAPNERIDLSKPFEENAVFSYALLRLYQITGEVTYLETGLKTVGYLTLRQAGFDDSYYFFKAAQFVRNNDLINVYQQSGAELLGIVKESTSNFWLPALLEKVQNQEPLDNVPKLRDEFSDVGFLVLAVLALFAGMLSFLSPCCLPVISAYFAHNVNAGKGEIFRNTVFFFLGLALVFSLLGMGATLLGSLFRDQRLLFTKIAGSIIILFGVLELMGKGFSGLQLRFRGNHRTPVGSFLFGSVFAIGWSACIGPILASLLLLAATSGTLLKGSGLLFVYAAGLGVPLFIVSFYFERIKTTPLWNLLQGKLFTFSMFKKQFTFHTTYLISGILLVVIGFLIFNDYLYTLNRYALQTEWVQNIIIGGEQFLKKMFLP